MATFTSHKIKEEMKATVTLAVVAVTAATAAAYVC